ncbi:MAG: ThuA domain-containing protein, partial [Verrucomicrobiota bacterium]
LLLVAALAATSLHAAPKKLLVVTTTASFRHSSIPTSEKILAQLAKDTGEFTVDFVQQPPGHPAVGSPPKLKPNATPEEKKAFDDAEAKFNYALKIEFQKLSPDNLKNYDAVAFVSTTGDLPLPNPQGFLDWIKAGHAFIGIHAASDTFHKWPDFAAMLGGEFKTHGPQVSVECINKDLQHPATAHLGKSWTLKQEEIYQFKNYETTKVHDLLALDKHPDPKMNHEAGHFPVSWHKQFGEGKVFYTSLGHREDIWDTDATIKDRKNEAEISKAYQQHVLGGIEWALGLKK